MYARRDDTSWVGLWIFVALLVVIIVIWLVASLSSCGPSPPSPASSAEVDGVVHAQILGVLVACSSRDVTSVTSDNLLIQGQLGALVVRGRQVPMSTHVHLPLVVAGSDQRGSA